MKGCAGVMPPDVFVRAVIEKVGGVVFAARSVDWRRSIFWRSDCGCLTARTHDTAQDHVPISKVPSTIWTDGCSDPQL